MPTFGIDFDGIEYSPWCPLVRLIRGPKQVGFSDVLKASYGVEDKDPVYYV